MSQIQLYNDNVIKLEYAPTNNKVSFLSSVVGSDGVVTLTESGQLSTAIYVSKTSGNDANAGSFASPVATINVAIGLCDSTHSSVIIIDDAIYLGELNTVTNVFFQYLYKLTGSTATMSLRNNGLVSTDLNTIYVSKTGSDANAGTSALPVLTIANAITKVTASKTCILIADSGTYVEPNFTMSGNFKYLYSNEFCSPTIVDATETTNFPNVATLFTKNTAGILHTTQCSFANGDIVVMYAKVTTLYYLILDSTGTTIKAESTITGITAGSQLYPACVAVNDTDVHIAYINGFGATPYIYHMVFNPYTNTAVVADAKVSATAITSSMFYPTIINASGTGVYIFWKNAVATAQVYYGSRFDGATQTIGPITLYTSSANAGNFVCVWAATMLSSGNLSYMYSTIEDNTAIPPISIRLATLNSSLVSQSDIVISDGRATLYGYEISNASLGGNCFCMQSTIDDNLLLSYNVRPAGSTVNFTHKVGIFTTSGVRLEEVSSVVIGAASGYSRTSVCVKYNYSASRTSNYAFLISTHYDATPLYTLKSYDNALIKSTIVTNIKGINLSTVNNKNPYSKCILLCTDETYIYNCRFYGTYSIINNMEHTSTHNNNIFIGSVSVRTLLGTYNNNQYVNCAYGALTIYSSGASVITVEHCDFSNNYSGLSLYNTSVANTTIKNNIFASNGIYGIYSVIANLPFSYSLMTDVTINTLPDITVYDKNPLYINDGFTNVLSLNLRLKQKLFDFTMNSPALNLSDDNRNCGSVDEDVIGGIQTTYTSATIKKPEVIPVSREYVNAINLQLVDGSYDSYKMSQSEIIELKWKGLYNSEYNVIDAIMLDDAKYIRVYFEPTTNPTVFYTFTVLRNSWNATSAYTSIDEFGKNDVSVKLARKYN